MASKRRTGKSSALPVQKNRKQKDPFLVELGTRIRAARLQRGHTSEGFAASLPIERSYYSGIERGVRNITVATLAKLARGLRVEPAALLPTLDQLDEIFPD